MSTSMWLMAVSTALLAIIALSVLIDGILNHEKEVVIKGVAIMILAVCIGTGTILFKLHSVRYYVNLASYMQLL